MNASWSPWDVMEAGELTKLSELGLQFGIRFEEEMSFAAVAPRLANAAFFNQKTFERMQKKSKARPAVNLNSRNNHSLHIFSKQDPNSIFSLFNYKHNDSHAFDKPFFENLNSRPQLEDSFPARPVDPLPSNFQNVNQFLSQNDFVKKIDPSLIRSIKPKEEFPTQNFSFDSRKSPQPPQPPEPEDPPHFREQDSQTLTNKYEEDVQALLHKI